MALYTSIGSCRSRNKRHGNSSLCMVDSNVQIPSDAPHLFFMGSSCIFGMWGSVAIVPFVCIAPPISLSLLTFHFSHVRLETSDTDVWLRCVSPDLSSSLSWVSMSGNLHCYTSHLLRCLPHHMFHISLFSHYHHLLSSFFLCWGYVVDSILRVCYIARFGARGEFFVSLLTISLHLFSVLLALFCSSFGVIMGYHYSFCSSFIP